jgi:predicted AAA+ superfamily ATPase
MTIETNNITIKTDVLVKEFKEHLDLANNKRVLFSGSFGTGKSTFLKDFSAKFNDDYFYLEIYPVNYSVSTNEDVFELIKFDLLFHLMGNYSKEADLKKEDFTLF